MKYVCVLRDLRSTNGTFVNNQPLGGQRKMNLVEGDLIQFALDDNQYRIKFNKDLVVDSQQSTTVDQPTKLSSPMKKTELINSIEHLSKELNERIELMKEIDDTNPEGDNIADVSLLQTLRNGYQSPVEDVSDSKSTERKNETDNYIKYVLLLIYLCYSLFQS